jgi:hypothetical protein
MNKFLGYLKSFLSFYTMVVIYTLFVRLGNKYEFTEQLYGLFVFLTPVVIVSYLISRYEENKKSK